MTARVSVFCLTVTSLIVSGCSLTRSTNSFQVGVSAGSFGLISRWAKKASTITIKIGNAALLKNRLIRVSFSAWARG
jgi:hypothetical protein